MVDAMNNTKERTAEIQKAAQKLLASVDVGQDVDIYPFAKQLADSLGIHLDTAKRHIKRAIGFARGETLPQHGGARPGAGFKTGVKRQGRRGKAKNN